MLPTWKPGETTTNCLIPVTTRLVQEVIIHLNRYEIDVLNLNPVDFRLRLGKESDDKDQGSEGGLAVATQKPKLKRPPMYKVIILNDDYTPMEFVVHVLERFFAMDREKATRIMLTIHTEGSAVAGIFPRDLAETKSEQINEYARENNHPLMSNVEMTD